MAGPSEQNLVAHLEFEGNALDGSGNANHGTINGGATTTSAEGRPQVILLDGTNDYVQINDNASLDFGTGNFSVAFWAKKLSAASGWDNLSGVNKWNGGGATPGANEWTVGLGSGSGDNRPSISIESGTTTYSAVSPDQMTIGQWYHTIGMRQGTQLKVYVNGVLKGTGTLPANTSVNNVGRNLLIGKILAGYETHAAFDDLYIYRRALSEDEVRKSYLMGSGSMVNNYLYNGGSELSSASGWYETFYRGYDAALGRFMQLDIKAGKYGSLSPYNYAVNDPVLFNDPMGDDYDTTDPMYGKRSVSGPGNHWSDYYRSAYGNFMMMSTGDFRSFYGLNDGYGGTNYARAGEVASALAQSSGGYLGVSFSPGSGTEAYAFIGGLMDAGAGGMDDFLKRNVWCHYCGELAYNGANGNKYYVGAWVSGNQTQGGTRTYAIGGADLDFSGLSSTSQAIVNATGGNGYNLIGGESAMTTQKVISDIKAAYTKGQAVQIYGYSLGGKVALDVARALNAANIPISLLVTIDSAEGPMSALVNRTVPSNVSVNFNFFQTTPSSIFSRGDYNTGTGLIFNYDLTSPTITHGNIDEATMNTAISLLTR